MSETLVELSREECLVLLGSMSIGRLAVAVLGQAPLVTPVNYALDRDVVVFRTAPGSKLDALRRQPVSFEVDFFDPMSRTGWSVLIRGRAYEALHWEVEHLDVRSWIGERPHWIRVEADEMTGRRIAGQEFVADARGYL